MTQQPGPGTPVLVFDIETIPDIEGLRRLDEAAADLPDDEVLARTGRDFQPLHLHRIVAIACLMRKGTQLRIRCLGEPEDEEAVLLQRFYEIIDRETPQLVSWNGGGFDLQVLQYRALRHGVTAVRYWETGERDRDFRWNNYLSRYHSRHLDLMDLLALHAPRASARLDDLARLCGFPGKLGMDGSQVWDAWRAGDIAGIRDYCETDVANTWLVYCRFQLMRGFLSRDGYEGELARLREYLESLGRPHWTEFLARWQDGP